MAIMQQEIKTIEYGRVNCYLVKAKGSFVLIDTGLPGKRAEIVRELEGAGCQRGALKVVLLTHGDYDHAGNAAYIREKYGAMVAMHAEDSARVERGDWTLGFKLRPDKFPLMYRIISSFIRPGPFDTFRPDIYVGDGQNLLEYGYEAQVLHLPGHTRGSIGILSSGGDLFCGDLMDNMGRPSLQFFIDDMVAARASITKLNGLGVKTVYPGHGRAFAWEQFLKNYH